MTRKPPQHYGFTDMFADMWLGSDRARQLEIDAKKQPAETDKKKNKSTKSKPKEEKPKPRQKEAEKNQVRKKPDPKTNDTSKSGTKDTKTMDDSDGFSRKEDKKLIKLKTEDNKPWKDIATELGKKVDEVKARWQKVRPDKQEGGEKDKDGEAKKDGKKDESKKEEANKKEKRVEKKALMQMDNDGAIVLEPDEHFNFEELVYLANVVQEEIEEMWGRVSLRFWELTDREVHPWDLREKVTGECVE